MTREGEPEANIPTPSDPMATRLAAIPPLATAKAKPDNARWSSYFDHGSRAGATVALAVVASLLVVVAVSLPYFLRFHGALATDQAIWGFFGDYVGGVLSTIFGLLSFLALVFALVLQNRSLADASEQLRLARDTSNREKVLFSSQLEIAQLTAELSALALIIQHLAERIEREPLYAEREDLGGLRESHIKRLEHCLSAIRRIHTLQEPKK